MLQGAVKTIKQFKPAIYYKAVYDEEANVLSPKTQTAARLVKGLKYDQYWHFSRRFVDDNYFGNTDNVFGDTSDLCVSAHAPRRSSAHAHPHGLLVYLRLAAGTSSPFRQEALRSRAWRSWKCPMSNASIWPRNGLGRVWRRRDKINS